MRPGVARQVYWLLICAPSRERSQRSAGSVSMTLSQTMDRSMVGVSKGVEYISLEDRKRRITMESDQLILALSMEKILVGLGG